MFVRDHMWADALLMSSPQVDLLVAMGWLFAAEMIGAAGDIALLWRCFCCACAYAAAKVPCAVDVLALEWLFCMVTPP